MLIKAVVLLYFVIFAVLIARRPGYTLAAMYVCLLGLEQWASANDSFFGVNSAVLNYASGALVIFGIGAAVVKGDRPFSLMPAWSLFALYVLIVLSYMWSIDRQWTVTLINHGWLYVIAYLVLLPLTLNNSEDLRDAVVGTAFAGAVVGLMILLGTEMIGNRSIAFAEGATNRYGRLEAGGNPLAIGELGGMVVFSAAIMRFSGISKAVMTVLRWGLIAIGLALVFRSGSRGQTFATLGLLPIFMMMGADKFRAKYLIAPLFGIVVIAALGWWATSFIPEATLARWQPENLTADYGGRIQMSRYMLDEWLHSDGVNWLFGLGFGASFAVIGTYPHVMVVQILAELGIIGLLVYIAFYTSAVVAWFTFFRNTKASPSMRAAAVIFGAFCTFQFVLSFKQGGISGGHYVWVFPAIVIRCAQIAQRERRRDSTQRRAIRPLTIPQQLRPAT